MPIIEMIYYWARAVPHRPAIIQSDMVTTFQGLVDAIESISERIDRLNLNRREPVAVSVANPAFMLATAFALLRNGYDAAPVNERLYPHLAGAGIRNLIYDTTGLAVSGGRNIRFDMSWLPDAKQQDTQRAYRHRPVENAGLVFFTSGTTGRPKKVTQTGAALQKLLEYPYSCASGAQQKILIMPGLTTSYGFNRVFEIFNAGKTVCLAPNSQAALALVDTFGVELIVASTVQALELVEVKKKNPAYHLTSLQIVWFGGGRISPERISDISTVLCRNSTHHYGSTEGGSVASAPLGVIADIPGAVGIVLPWVELEIVDETGEVLPAGSEGLIRYRTPRFLQNLEALSADNIPGVKDRWFYPGDVGLLTAGGVLCLAGRTSDVINRGGIKVSSTKIEEILEGLPEVNEAAACGVMGASGLEEIWVAIVAGGPIDIEQIKRHLSDHDELGITPDELFVVDKLPRGELGKVQKHRLKELLQTRKKDA
jgi:acyl-coenzyme A synthetase/AMP-(fatty) acid ligase